LIFKRKIYEKLLEWKKCNGSEALIIEGARRVGKSTIVKEFAQNEYESFLLIDFARTSEDVKSYFVKFNNDLNTLFMMLQNVYGVELKERKSLIIFDEVQRYPTAREMIKYLVADGRYDYIETGSLISIKENVKDIVIPSEEKSIRMYPMDFEEFCIALENKPLMSYIRDCFSKTLPLERTLHDKAMQLFREYMLVGGMPQAIERYISSNDFREVDDVKRDILTLYEDDFHKIDPTGKISMLFDAIPAQLMGNASRYQVSSVLAGNRAGGILEQISELKESRTVLVSYHANDPGPGMAHNKDLSKFKLFTADTGLFVTLAFKDKAFTENDIYSRLLSGKLQTNLGYLYENAVAQALATNGHALYYHTFLNEKSKHNYEIDFLISEKNKISPIEVKSSGYKSHPSLDAFSRKFSSRINRELLIYTKDYRREGRLEMMPIIMTQFL